MIFDRAFFEKHQTTLLKAANSRWTRWLLGLNRLPEKLKGWTITKITPNSIRRTFIDSNDGWKLKHEAAVFARPRFGEALAFNLSPFAYFQSADFRSWQWRFSPVGALGALVALLIPKIGFLGFIGTTDTVYPTAGSYGGIESPGGTWATAHDAAAGTTLYTGAAQGFAGCQYYSGNIYILRWPLNFDLSGISASATISAASMNTTGSYRSGGSAHINVYGSTAENTITTADYDQGGTTAFCDTGYATDGYNTDDSTYNTINLNATGRAAVEDAFGGTFKMMFREQEHDVANSTSGTSTFQINMNTAAATGTSKDPYLSVTYTSSSAYTKKLSETINFSEARTNQAGLKRSYSETVNFSEVLAKIKGHVRTFLETVGFSEVLVRLHGHVRSFSETVAFSDVYARTVQFFRSLSETLAVSEVLATLRARFLSFSETVGFSDAFSRVCAYARSFSESVAASEVLAKMRGLVRAFSETVNFSEVLAKAKTFLRAFSETVHFSEVLARASAFARSFSETIGLTDLLVKAGFLWTKESEPAASVWTGEAEPPPSIWTEEAQPPPSTWSDET